MLKGKINHRLHPSLSVVVLRNRELEDDSILKGEEFPVAKGILRPVVSEKAAVGVQVNCKANEVVGKFAAAKDIEEIVGVQRTENGNALEALAN